MDRCRQLALWEHRAQASAWGRSSRCPVRKLSGPWMCSQGRLMGRVLAASQGTQNVPSQNSESIWVGSLPIASLALTVPLPFGRPRAIIVLSDALLRGQEGRSHCPLALPSALPPASRMLSPSCHLSLYKAWLLFYLVIEFLNFILFIFYTAGSY